MIGHVSIVVLVLFGGSDANPVAPHQSQLDVNHKKPLQTFRPYNIAHRGSNGEIPEETAAAYSVTNNAFFYIEITEQYFDADPNYRYQNVALIFSILRYISPVSVEE
jgi:hypothetical protein